MLVAALVLAVQGPTDLSADFDVPEGLKVTLWAETPQLYNPTAMDVDSAGRVWVTEAVNYRRWGGRNAGFTREGGDRVVILEDKDKDGRCDSSVVYAQDPELVAPLGILVLEEEGKSPRVFVSCSPSIFEFRDKNGDGDALDAGEKEIFLTGFGGHDHDHGVHSLVKAPNGRLYVAVGNAGPHIVTDKSGWTLRSGSVYNDGGAALADNKPGLVSDDGKVYTGGLILSVKPDGTDLRVEAHNFRNPYEVALDAAGEMYTFDNDDEVVTCRASWVMPGGNYGFFSADGSRTWRADLRPGQSTYTAQWHMDDPGVVPIGTHTGSGGPTGVLFYKGRELENYYYHLLACDAGRGTVFAFQPRIEGAGKVLKPVSPLIGVRPGRESEGARRFRPSDIDIGPEGELYLADWFDPGVGGHAMGDESCRGRILLIQREIPPPFLPVACGTLSAPRDEYWWELADPKAVVSIPDDPWYRAWLLDALRKHEEHDHLLSALAKGFDATDRVYVEAFGLACEGREAEVFARLAPELGPRPLEWSPQFAALAWRLHPPEAIPAFVARAMAKELSGEARKQAIDALAFVKTREAADAMANLALASPEDLRPYARWWLENRSTNEWSEWVDRSALGGTLANAELAWKSGLIRTGKYEVALDVRGASHLWLVVTEGEHGNSYDWADWLAPRFERADGSSIGLTALPWLSVETGYGSTYVGKNCEGGPLVVEKETFTDGIGTHAPATIAYAVPEGATTFRATAAPDDMGAYRAGSNNELEFQVWLERAPTRARIEELVAQVKGKDAQERRAALGELARDGEGALWLIRAAERGDLDAAAKAIVAEAIFQNADLGARARASGVFQRSGDRPRPSVASLAALAGDPARGRELFLDPRAQCSTCHAFTHGGRRRGSDIGPELTGVGAKFDAARTFDAILNPSAEIAHGFETVRIETTDGELLAGFLLADGDTLVLKDTQGKRHAIPKDEVASRERETLSVMPDGVAAGLSDQELADLVAFLRDDPARAPKFGPEVEVFNSRDFTGWTHHLPDRQAKFADVWSVKDGSIVCQGNPVGYIRTTEHYTNFELTLEWRFDPARGPGNSGVLFRMQAPDQVWPRSIEAQLMATNAGDFWNIEEFPMAVDLERTEGRHTTRRAPSSEKPLGEWNSYRIRADRGLVTLEVNGVVQNTASWCAELSGPICLQSEGAYIEFRNIRLRPIVGHE
jgi:putative membrane-bound dehydrogenase-like protein